MQNRWLILFLITLMYLPVAIDASILHIAIPTLGMELKASGDELLWIIDIYSLVMAGLLLPMGALGDRIGYKKLSTIGLSIFGFASLCAALSTTTYLLIFSRCIMAIGGAMILPATLSGIRTTFTQEKDRNFALGIWSTIGVGGAAIGPLIGGYLLQYFHWGSVFLVNVPLVLAVVASIVYIVPKQKENMSQTVELKKALVLITALLLIVYAIKTGLRGNSALGLTITIAVLGALLLYFFVKNELSSPTPMIDFQLLKNRVLLIGIVMAMTAMIAIIGFELLMAQELQFVHDLTPLQAGIFMLPIMLSSGLSGPIAAWLSNQLGLRRIATLGMALSGLSFFGLATFDFMLNRYWTIFFMILLGFSCGSALLASTSAIMTSAPPDKSASAGAIESMAYELGAGFGVVIFGVMLTTIYASNIVLPIGLESVQVTQAINSISEAFVVAENVKDPQISDRLVSEAKKAFTQAHVVVLITAGILLTLLSVITWRFLPARITTVTTSH